MMTAHRSDIRAGNLVLLKPFDWWGAVGRGRDDGVPCEILWTNRFSERELLGAAVLALLVFAGSSMQGYAHGTADAFLVAFGFLLLGLAVVGVVAPRKRPEWLAFLVTYAICVFVGGLAQCYSQAVFGTPQSTPDAPLFLEHISPKPPFTTLADMPPFNSPLAVVIWQQAYKVAWWLGLDFGCYTAVMFNALVVGLTAVVTVRTARELFGDDEWRLRRVGMLFAFCGIFILFGAILLRDCLTTFFHALVLWALVRWLCRSTLRDLSLALLVTGVSASAMVYLRFEAVMMFGFFWLLGFLFWLRKDRWNLPRLMAIFLVGCVAVAGRGQIHRYLQMSQKSQARTMASYLRMATREAQDDSLGLRLVVKQPIPIRLVLGSGFLAVYPIPLWAYLQEGAHDSHLIRSYHGVYQVLVLPLVLVGSLMASRQSWARREGQQPLSFLVAYLLVNLGAVVATSLEQRHLAQFLPAFLILSAVPDTREEQTRARVRHVEIAWFGTVILVHLAWAIAKR